MYCDFGLQLSVCVYVEDRKKQPLQKRKNQIDYN